MKQCRSSRIFKAIRYYMGGGGGSAGGDIQFRQPSTEFPTITNWEQGQTQNLDTFSQNQPLLNAAEGSALSYWKDLPALLGPLMKQFQTIPGQIGSLASSLAPTYKSVSDIAAGGQLPPELMRDAQQQALTESSAAGIAHTNPAIASEVLNTEREREARQQSYAGLQQQLAGTQAGLYSQEGSMAEGLAGGVQALQSGGLNQLTGVESAKTGNFATIANPILSYLSNLYGGNLAASVQQAQIQQQADTASQGKTAGIGGGILSAVGTVGAAAL